jgi:hypothetical protein
VCYDFNVFIFSKEAARLESRTYTGCCPVGAGRACNRPLPHGELRAELATAEAEGGSFTTEDVRRYAREHLDRLNQTLAR